MVVLKHPRLRRRGHRWTHAEQPVAAVQLRASETQTKPRSGHSSEATPPFPGPKFTGYEKWWDNRVEAPAPGPCADDGMNGERRLHVARPRSSARGLVTKDVAAGRRSGFTTSRRRCGPRSCPCTLVLRVVSKTYVNRESLDDDRSGNVIECLVVEPFFYFVGRLSKHTLRAGHCSCEPTARRGPLARLLLLGVCWPRRYGAIRNRRGIASGGWQEESPHLRLVLSLPPCYRVSSTMPSSWMPRPSRLWEALFLPPRHRASSAKPPRRLSRAS